MVFNRGNGIYRSIILAFAGLALIGAGKAPQPPAKSEQQKSQAKSANAAPDAKALPPQPSEQVQAPKDGQPCGNSRYRSDDDLCAQWKAADAARDAANWAWWQLGLSALGVLGLGLTLWFNFRALKLAEGASKETKDALIIAERNASAAMRGAMAAGDANEIMREGQRKQLRPYVYLEKPRVGWQSIQSFGIIGDFANTTLRFRNYGMTPAKNVVVKARTYIGGIWNEPFDLAESGIEDVHPVIIADIPPHRTKKQDGFAFGGIEAGHGDIRGGVASVFIVGQIRYTDDRGEEYYTNFRLAQTATDFPSQKFATCPDWNTAV